MDRVTVLSTSGGSVLVFEARQQIADQALLIYKSLGIVVDEVSKINLRDFTEGHLGIAYLDAGGFKISVGEYAVRGEGGD